MKVEYIDHMGSDLAVANSARVSFNKESTELSQSDTKLISYLARHDHWTPFAHPQITLRVTAPIFIRTQCFKHKQGFVENEVSRRYVDDTPEFYLPSVWRSKPTDGAKQGSSKEEVKILRVKMGGEITVKSSVENFYEYALDLYEEMIEVGVAPEQARMVLPQSMYTSWYWTGSLAAYGRFYKQRIDPHAQVEIQQLAKMVGDVIQPLFPVSWKVLSE